MIYRLLVHLLCTCLQRHQIIAALLITLLSSCSQTPVAFIEQQAASHSLYLQKNPATSKLLPYIIISSQKKTQHLYVYMDGDGMPWVDKGTRVAADPSIINPLALQLMLIDNRTTAYLGRPCYYVEHPQATCTTDLWTSARYGSKVLHTMTAALKKLIKNTQAETVSLVAYSGGASLAVLLANRVPQVNNVISIAGNLDTQAWVKHHQYLPLSASINPMFDPIKTSYAHTVLAGAHDKNIPLPILITFAQSHEAEIKVFPQFNHSCCWLQAWPSILQNLK